MKSVPKFKTDAEAEDFLQKDLSDLDFSQFKPAHFEIEQAKVDMRVKSEIKKLTHQSSNS